MRDRVALSLVAVALGIGVVGGHLARGGAQGPTQSRGESPQPAELDSASRSGRRGEPGAARSVGPHGVDVARVQGSWFESLRDEPEPGAGDDPGTEAATAETVETAEQAQEIRRLQAELADLRAERLELLGSPIEPPSSSAPRFAGSALSSAVRDAMGSESVPGDIEATDCAEHPCIVFGRLDGDEEDMEEIERSPSLAPYADDVLTLLFWATTVEEGVDARAPETGLFALAFYSAEERESRGEELDRRIRARVMEYWNTDRPGARG
jgi:hypothetical protein